MLVLFLLVNVAVVLVPRTQHVIHRENVNVNKDTRNPNVIHAKMVLHKMVISVYAIVIQMVGLGRIHAQIMEIAPAAKDSLVRNVNFAMRNLMVLILTANVAVMIKVQNMGPTLVHQLECALANLDIRV